MFYLALGDPVTARGLFADALQLEPYNSDALIGLADADSRVGLGRSQHLYDQALAADPLTPKVRRAADERNLDAREHEMQTETEKAESDPYPTAVAREPSLPINPAEENLNQQDVELLSATDTEIDPPEKSACHIQA